MHSDLSQENYGLLFPAYWKGRTGIDILEAGGSDALLLGAYLMGNDHANAIGLYHLPFTDVRIGLTIPRLVTAFEALDRAAYATYDYGTQYVWVKEMARIRMGLRSRSECLPKRDSRNIMVARLYRQYAGSTPFVWAFFQRYRKTFHIRTGQKPVVTLIRRPTFASDGPLLRAVTTGRTTPENSRTDLN